MSGQPGHLILAQLASVGRSPAEQALLLATLATLHAQHGLVEKIEAEPEVAGIVAQFIERLQRSFASVEDVRGLRVLDMPCGSNNSRSPITGRRTAQFEPWMCRLLLELGAEPVGIDFGDLHGERFEHVGLDLGAPGALDRFPEASFDAIHESRLFGSPEFTEAYGPGESDRIRREIARQEVRMLKPGGILIHSDIDPRLR